MALYRPLAEQQDQQGMYCHVLCVCSALSLSLSSLVKQVINLPNLHMIQTVHSIKLAEGLNKAWEKVKAENAEKKQQLNVLVQINTSGEDGM